MTELKPCPFCGGRAELIVHRYVPNGVLPTYQVVCSKCFVKTYGWFDSQEGAEAAWNRRISKPYESRNKLPCPKCGVKPRTWFPMKKGSVDIKCPECELSRYGDTEIEAIRNWNKMARGEG